MAEQAVVEQVSCTRVMPNQTSPRPLADQWTDSRSAERPRQEITSGACHFVYQHHLGAEMLTEGPGTSWPSRVCQ